MQTFLPYPSITASLECLDSRRLGKQRVEALQIHMIISRPYVSQKKGWARHPAVRMWKGYAGFLRLYHDYALTEWVRRGYVNNMPYLSNGLDTGPYPIWWGDPSVHLSHQSNLLRKDAEFYGKYGWRVDPRCPYEWPNPAEYEALDDKRYGRMTSFKRHYIAPSIVVSVDPNYINKYRRSR